MHWLTSYCASIQSSEWCGLPWICKWPSSFILQAQLNCLFGNRRHFSRGRTEMVQIRPVLHVPSFIITKTLSLEPLLRIWPCLDTEHGKMFGAERCGFQKTHHQVRAGIVNRQQHKIISSAFESYCFALFGKNFGIQTGGLIFMLSRKQRKYRSPPVTGCES